MSFDLFSTYRTHHFFYFPVKFLALILSTKIALDGNCHVFFSIRVDYYNLGTYLGMYQPTLL
jgi:hypothetical protein